MITHAQYMEGSSKLHHPYHLEIADDLGVQLSPEVVARCRFALESGDEHLNTIPLHEWDNLAYRYSHFGYRRGNDWSGRDPRPFSGNWRVHEVMKARGTTSSLATMVCVLKAKAREQALTTNS